MQYHSYHFRMFCHFIWNPIPCVHRQPRTGLSHGKKIQCGGCGTQSHCAETVALSMLILFHSFILPWRFASGRLPQQTQDRTELSKTSKLEDYDKVADLLRPGRDKESEDAFIKNIKLIRKLESEMGDTRRELYSYFRSTHYSLSDMMPTKLSQKPTTNHVDHSRQLPVTRDECKDSSFLDKLTTGEDEAAEWARVNELLSGIPFFKRRF